MTGSYRPLDREECHRLADTLGDSPETAIQVHLLRHGLAHAYIEGSVSRFEGVVIQSLLDPGEPMAFGDAPELLWQILQSVPGWTCISVTLECANPLSNIIGKSTGKRIRHYGDVYHVLHERARIFTHQTVRNLTVEDIPLLERAPDELRRCAYAGYETPVSALAEGVAVGSVVAGQLVSVAHTSARTAHHADIGVHTLEPWRRQGLSTAAVSLVAQNIQACGQMPIWSTGEDNYASLRVAQKIGFTEVSRRVYLIPQ